jgi:hypothetical protein
MKVKIGSYLLWLALVMLVAACGSQPSPQLPSTTPSSEDDAKPTVALSADSTDAPEVPKTEETATQSMVDALSAAGLPAGWAPQGEPALYGVDNLYDLVDGEADAYFVYAFEQAAVRTYENASGDTLRVEIWRTATPADAYGLYSGYRSGTPVAVGNEGDADPGRRIGFWQERYNVRLFALRPVPEEQLLSFAEVLASALPNGGDQPALATNLPMDGLEERSVLFFREQLTLQDYVWLDGENLLGLGPKTEGVLATYQMDDNVLQLLLVHYPDAEASEAGLQALRSMPPDNLLVADRRGDVLGAVLGVGDEASARMLLANALGN